jgi:hypothetical protein
MVGGTKVPLCDSEKRAWVAMSNSNNKSNSNGNGNGNSFLISKNQNLEIQRRPDGPATSDTLRVS